MVGIGKTKCLNREVKTMITESQKDAIELALMLGRKAFERGEDEPFATNDEAFCELAQEYGNIGMLIRAYNRGFDDAMMDSVDE